MQMPLFYRSRCLVRLVALLALVVPYRAQAQTQFAHLTLQSQRGDYVVLGSSFDITYPSNDISAQIRRTLPGGAPAELLFVLGLGYPTPASSPFATLFFGTDQLGIPIQPGTYTNAQRADFAQPGHPGLDVGFDHVGNNTLTGSFTISD